MPTSKVCVIALANVRVIALTVLLLISLLAHGQESHRESLLIGAGDILHVTVYSAPEMEQHARVSDSGEIKLMLGGNVRIAGKTPAQAAEAIEQVLVEREILRHPHVSVIVEEYATTNVSVLGQVRTPGTFSVATPRSILDVLAMAGGVTELADRQITIERANSHEKVIFFLSNDAAAAVHDQVMVNPGDVVLVPKVNLVYVLGDVGRPGGFPMATNDSRISALQAVAMANGTNKTAAAGKACLIRKTADGYQKIELRLKEMESGKRPDVPLHAEDIIYVPFSYARNFVINSSAIVAAAGSAAVYHF